MVAGFHKYVIQSIVQVESVVISTNDLIDSIFTSSSKMRRRMVYGEGLTGGNGGQGNLVHLFLVH